MCDALAPAPLGRSTPSMDAGGRRPPPPTRTEHRARRRRGPRARGSGKGSMLSDVGRMWYINPPPAPQVNKLQNTQRAPHAHTDAHTDAHADARLADARGDARFTDTRTPPPAQRRLTRTRPMLALATSQIPRRLLQQPADTAPLAMDATRPLGAPRAPPPTVGLPRRRRSAAARVRERPRCSGAAATSQRCCREGMP